MKPEQRSEILYLYVGYFATIGLGLIPSLSWYAVGALALQLLYAIVRYVGTSKAEQVYRSHAFNYILAVGVSFAIGILATAQLQAAGLEPTSIIANILTASRYSSSANSIGYVIFMIALEILAAIFWPIVLILRGLYLINTGRPVFGSYSATAFPGVERHNESKGRWLASAMMPDGRVLQFTINLDPSTKVIGRDKREADFVIEHDTISRPHARLDVKEDSIWISDLGSTNMTKVADRVIGFNPIRLHPGDKIQLGEITVTISAA